MKKTFKYRDMLASCLAMGDIELEMEVQVAFDNGVVRATGLSHVSDASHIEDLAGNTLAVNVRGMLATQETADTLFALAAAGR